MRDLSRITRVNAIYSTLPAGTSCVPGQGALHGSRRELVSVAAAGEIAAAYRDAIVPTAQVIQVDPQGGDFATGGVAPFTFGITARIAFGLPADDGGTVALADIGGTTVVMQDRSRRTTCPRCSRDWRPADAPFVASRTRRRLARSHDVSPDDRPRQDEQGQVAITRSTYSKDTEPP